MGPPRFNPDGRPMTPSGGQQGRPMSPAGASRPMRPNDGNVNGNPRLMSPEPRSMSPSAASGFSNTPPRPPPQGRPGPPPQRPSTSQGNHRPMSPGAFNQAPRPLSPNPMPRGPGQQRSMSPGPYGAGARKPDMPVSQRRRSNSAGALGVQTRRNSPPGPSPLGDIPGWRPPQPMKRPSPPPGQAL